MHDVKPPREYPDWFWPVVVGITVVLFLVFLFVKPRLDAEWADYRTFLGDVMYISGAVVGIGAVVWAVIYSLVRIMNRFRKPK
jgi:hypothetical protein